MDTELKLIAQALQRLTKALHELPESRRQTFMLYRTNSAARKDIARIPGADSHTVEHQLAATIAHLERRLFQRWE